MFCCPQYLFKYCWPVYHWHCCIRLVLLLWVQVIVRKYISLLVPLAVSSCRFELADISHGLQENKHYARFKEGRSYSCFYELTEILEGWTTIGKHAQSSTQSDVHHSLWSAEKTTASASRLKRKAKVDELTSDFWWPILDC